MSSISVNGTSIDVTNYVSDGVLSETELNEVLEKNNISTDASLSIVYDSNDYELSSGFDDNKLNVSGESAVSLKINDVDDFLEMTDAEKMAYLNDTSEMSFDEMEALLVEVEKNEDGAKFLTDNKDAIWEIRSTRFDTEILPTLPADIEEMEATLDSMEAKINENSGLMYSDEDIEQLQNEMVALGTKYQEYYNQISKYTDFTGRGEDLDNDGTCDWVQSFEEVNKRAFEDDGLSDQNIATQNFDYINAEMGLMDRVFGEKIGVDEETGNDIIQGNWIGTKSASGDIIMNWLNGLMRSEFFKTWVGASTAKN